MKTQQNTPAQKNVVPKGSNVKSHHDSMPVSKSSRRPLTALAQNPSPNNAPSAKNTPLPHDTPAPQFHLDVSKIMKRLKMNVDKERQLGEVLEKAAKVMTMNAIQNILYVKEAMGKPQNGIAPAHPPHVSARMITSSDIKETQALMKRMKFYAGIQYGGGSGPFPPTFTLLNSHELMRNAGNAGNAMLNSQGAEGQTGGGGPTPPAFYMPHPENARANASSKTSQPNQAGGSRAESFPMSYFNPQMAEQEPYYAKSQVAPFETQTSPISRDAGFARPTFSSSFPIDNMTMEEQHMAMGQRGGNMLTNTIKSNAGRDLIGSANIEAVIAQLNNRYKKNPIQLQNHRVLSTLKATVNANLEKLFEYYKTTVSKELLEVEKLKSIIKTNPTFIHMSTVPKGDA